MKCFIYIVLFLIVAPLQWTVSMIGLGLTKVWEHITVKLMECRMKNNDKEC